jgi:uncharacterized damage-inducible protein DinB
MQSRGVMVQEYPDQDSIRDLFVQEKDAWQVYLTRLTDEELNGSVTLTTLRKHERSFPLWLILQHLILHGMQHHSELAQLLSAHDLSPGNIDFIFYPG